MCVAQLRVEIGERLVHQERARLADDGPPHRHALALPAGELARPALELLLQLEQARDVAHPAFNLLAADLPQLEREGEVLEDRLVRVERVVLEHHGDIALARRQPVDDLRGDADLTLAHMLEACDHPQRRRLAAAGWPDEHHELAVGDLQREVLHGDRAVREDLSDVFKRDLGHVPPFAHTEAGAESTSRRTRIVRVQAGH